MRLLALDPALRNSGYAILEKEGSKVRAVNFGVIRNKTQLSMPGCLVEIHRQIDELIRLHFPNECAVEGLIHTVGLGFAADEGLTMNARPGFCKNFIKP